ncbi:MAG: peroxiredoxin [Firmicutes bacterium]|nr:peroxiredoxin [Bacillota bacterium]
MDVLLETAQAETEAPALPRIGDPAPPFEAKTTQGMLKLSDLAGKWVVLFSHPADFTPVCTTEFVAFARRAEEFARRNVQLVGLSIDSVYSHLAWLRNIEERFGVKVPFPIIADLDMTVARRYGMIHPKEGTTSTVRALFIIDDRQVVRAILYYPMSTGRNIDEVLRIIDSLQTVDREKVATPADWHPGEPVILPPPQTQADLQARLERAEQAGYECKDWYLCLRKA